jgi:transcriptional regulator with XRE-family HTH domain
LARATEAFYDTLGRRIFLLRKKRGLTQEQLGARLSPQVTRASIANIESGKQRVLAHSLAQFANALGVSADELIQDRPDPADSDLRQQVEAQLSSRLEPAQLIELTRKLGLNEREKADETTDQNTKRS